ncbi:YigZ family protein, partial [Staphylococcus aureus]|nr:YigZ family protein [Staphylococcus aureus]
DYEAFINFLNQMTAGNFDLTEETPKQLPFDIPTE